MNETALKYRRFFQEKLSKKHDQELAAALKRTEYQEKNLDDYKHLEGCNVRVVWNTKEHELFPFGASDWNDVKVLEVVRFGGGEIMAYLQGYNHPVRVERLIKK